MTFPDTGVLAAVPTSGALRALLASPPDGECATGVFEACLLPIVYSRHHWLKYRGEYRVRADLRAALEDLRTRDPDSWDDVESDFLFALLALCVANVGLDELTDRVDSTAVHEVLLERFQLYSSVLPEEPAAALPDELLALAARVSELRVLVERTHYPYSVIDGRAWHRTEALLPHEAVDLECLPEAVERLLTVDFGVPAGPPPAQRLASAARVCLAEHGEVAPLLRGIMAATLVDPVLRADHVTLTCPTGDLLDTPELMTTSAAFFTETLLRDGLDLADHQEQIGHESPDQLQRTIRARMLKLKRGAIRGLYQPGCLQGRFVEKHGGHMIFRNEDAHYRGHQSIGCSSGGRASFALRYRRGEVDAALTPMIGDYRVVRMSHDERDTFTGPELAYVIPYAEWIRLAVEQVYRDGGVVHRDGSDTEVSAAPDERVPAQNGRS